MNEQHRKVRELYLSGKKTTEIAKILGYNRRTIYSILKNLDIPSRYPNCTPEDKKRWGELYLEGNGVKDIAAMYGRSSCTITAAIRGLGIPQRSRPDRPDLIGKVFGWITVLEEAPSRK